MPNYLYIYTHTLCVCVYLYGQGKNNPIILLPYEVDGILQMTLKISGSAWNCFGRGVIDRMRKTETVCKCLHEFMTCLGLLCGRGVFLLLYMEGSFILLPADDMTWSRDNGMES